MRKLLLATILLVLASSAGFAALPSAMITFTGGTTILSADVNSNFTSLYTPLNGNINTANIMNGGVESWDLSPTGTFTLDAVTVTTTFRIPNSAGAAATTAGTIKINSSTPALSFGDGTNARTVDTLEAAQTITGQKTFSAALLGADGTVSLPGYSFSADTDSGLYRVGANDIALAVNGTKILETSSTAIVGTVPFTQTDGTVLLPSYTFADDLDTGLSNVTANAIGFSAGGAQVFTINSSNVTASVPVLGPAGSSSAPSYSFTGDPNTGVFDAAADVLGFATAGSTRAVFDANGVFVMNSATRYGTRAGMLFETDVATSGTTFSGGSLMSWSSGNSGVAGLLEFCRSRANGVGTHTIVQAGDRTGIIAFSGSNGTSFDDCAYIIGQVDGTPGASADMPGVIIFSLSADGSATPAERFRIASTQVTSTVPVLLPAGTAAAPAFTFSGDVDTGMYNFGANQLGFAAGGTNSVTITSQGITVTDIWKSNSKYTNPDYVFEQAFTGKVEKFAANYGAKDYQLLSLDEHEAYARAHLQLPRVKRGNKSDELFTRTEIGLEKTEELAIYIYQLNHRIKALELALEAALEKREKPKKRRKTAAQQTRGDG